jgi:hypothetical protein
VSGTRFAAMRVINSFSAIPADDIRIAAAYSGLAFKWERWRRPHPNWDHDHCFFCKACICDSGKSGHCAHAFVLRHGEDSPFWVCRSCFKLVRSALEWRIERANAPAPLRSGRPGWAAPLGRTSSSREAADRGPPAPARLAHSSQRLSLPKDRSRTARNARPAPQHPSFVRAFRIDN